MREILFRGKRTDNGEWVEGFHTIGKFAGKEYYAIERKEQRIVTYDYENVMQPYEVDPATIGQYTGLTDKNGKKIFEGDIVEVDYDINYVGVAAERIGMFEVVFDDGCFMKKGIQGKKGLFHFIGSDVCKIIGNIYDTPELLKGGADNE